MHSAVITIGVVALVALAGGLAWARRRSTGRPRPVDRPRDPAHLLDPAPQIGGITLRNWLIQRHRRDGVWQEVVSEFYTRAAADPEIAAYFTDVDLPRLQRHFMAALVVLTHTGLTVGALDAMRDRHAHLGITGDIYDRTVAALVEVLTSKGVPSSAIYDLTPAVQRLREVIVTA